LEGSTREILRLERAIAEHDARTPAAVLSFIAYFGTQALTFSQPLSSRV